MRARLFALALALLLAPGCASMSARSAFTRGEKARQKGDVDEAINAYEQAAKSDPKKPEYKKALEETRAQAVQAHVDEARAAEARSDFPAAVKAWEAAMRYAPGNAELPARRDLAILKTKQADPIEFYEAAKKLAAAIPGDAAVQKTLKDAKTAAVTYHLRLADTYADAKAWDRAHASFDAAKTIDPDNAVFKGATYKASEARFLEALGDEKSKAGDPVAAFQAYEKAAALKSSPALEAKLRAAKRGAGPVLEQYDQAKTAEANKQWEEAAELYTLVSSRNGAPPDVPERAARARKESAKIRADRAKGFAEKGLVDKATAELTLALEHTDGPKDALSAMQEALDLLSNGKAGEANAKIEAARAAGPELAIVQVAPAVVVLLAKASFEQAKKQADASPADALLALRKLEAFAAKFDGFAALKERLVKRAFGALVEDAEKLAAEKRWDAAAERLAAALDISKPPQNLAEPLKAGSAALTKKEWDTARERFGQALDASAGKSNVARVGKKVATEARLAELKKDAEEARATEDSLRAASAYRAILEIDPNDADAKAGSDSLRGALVDGALRSAKANEAAGKLGAAYVYYYRVLELDPKEPESKAAVAAIAKQLSAGEEPEALVAQVVRGDQLGTVCANAEKDLRERLILYLNKTRKLGAEYLAKEQVTLVDENKRPAPPVLLRTAIETCNLDPKAGFMQISLQLQFNDEVLVKDQAVVKLDTSGVPKDELADGLGPKRVEKLLLGEAAKVVTNAIRPHAAKLADWRAVGAEGALKANDAEAAARAYAVLTQVKAPSDREKKALRDLGQFLLNRYR